MAKVRVARAFRLPIIAVMTALALSGCMHATGPVAVAQPQSDLDSLAYGQPYRPAPAGVVSSPSDVADSGGAITTEIAPAGEFYFAEDYHQQYLAKNPAGYCGLGGTGVSCPIGAGVSA